MASTTMCILKRDSAEWHTAWKMLAFHDGKFCGHEGKPGSTLAEDYETGERWQLMGTALTEEGWVHEFRHRWHPVTKKREYAHLPASKGWTPDKEGI